MEFGFDAPVTGPMSNPEDLITLVQQAEEQGYQYLYVSDHIVVPNTVASRYPYTSGGKPPFGSEFLEQLTVAGFLAGQTSTLKLLTSVMVVPYRAPLHTAKILSTIDRLSNGRLVLGCGVGWMREEFEALEAPPFEERGAVTDEYIRAFKELWTSEEPTFDGEYVRFSDITFEPKPVQTPHPPIWIGGESPAAMRRVARLGDGWYPISYNTRHPIPTAVAMGEYLARLWAYVDDAGRKRSDIAIAYHGGVCNGDSAESGADGKRRPFTGTPAQIAEDVRAYEEVGVRHMFLSFPGSTVQEVLGRMERFMAEVGPLIGL